MNIKYEVREHGVLKIKYDKEEMEKLFERFEAVGLSKAKTEKGFGRDVKVEYYRENSKQRDIFISLIKETANTDLDNSSAKEAFYNNLLDDINTPLIVSGKINIAALRVIPKSDTVEIETEKYLSYSEVVRIIFTLSFVIRLFMKNSRTISANLSI